MDKQSSQLGNAIDCLGSICRYIVLLWLLFLSTIHPSVAESKIDIAPLFYGPNAFSIPQMSDGRTTGKLVVDLSAVYHIGFDHDQTITPHIKLSLPLFTPRVTLTVWMPIVEFYHTTSSRARVQHLDNYKETGAEAGDVYISTDIHVLKQGRYIPDIVVRAALKTASGGGSDQKRYYDGPGYFFDLTVAKSLYLNHGFIKELRGIVAVGFLCWQTGTHSQNDAYMYGLQGQIISDYLSINLSYSGYNGWIRNGDCPQSIQCQIKGNIKSFQPYISYQYGLRNYPFHQLQIGIAYPFDVLNRSSVKKRVK